MFERFTEQARQVVVLAQDEARQLRHGYVGTEHFLLALLREEQGLAAELLESHGVTLPRVKQMVIAIVGSGSEAVSGQVPFTPRAKNLLELALREALTLEHNFIAGEHLLLGLLREPEGVAARILSDLGVDAGALRKELVEPLAASPPPAPSEPGGASLAGRSRPLSARARRVLRLAEEEAARLGSDEVGTAHLLLGLAKEAEGELRGTDAEVESIRSELRRLLGEDGP